MVHGNDMFFSEHSGKMGTCVRKYSFSRYLYKLVFSGSKCEHCWINRLQSVIFQQIGDWDADKESDEAILEKSNHRAFLAYQWGVWVTAWARWHLEEGIKLAHQKGAEFIYCDTDSVKQVIRNIERDKNTDSHRNQCHR